MFIDNICNNIEKVVDNEWIFRRGFSPELIIVAFFNDSLFLFMKPLIHSLPGQSFLKGVISS